VADPGFTDAGTTAHFTFEFNQTLNAPAAVALSAALIQNAERDYISITSWFDGLTPVGVPFRVKINPRSTTRSGSNDGNRNITIDVGATTDFDLAQAVLVAEMIEIFMRAQNSGWMPGRSHGEALSQAAAFLLYPSKATGLDGPQTWLDSADPRNGAVRPDFVSVTDPTDTNKWSYGCGLLFVYYLESELGFSMRAIVQAAADTFEGVFHNLTLASGAFVGFSALLNARFPSGTASRLAGSTNPFPLPSPVVLSTERYLAKHPLAGQRLAQVIGSKNIGNLRALLNSDRPTARIA
jgi:hypothetical protein